MDCTIIIPVIKINDLLLKVINKCLEIHDNVRVLVVCNQSSDKMNNSKRVIFKKTKKRNISEKRNLGVSSAKSKYIAFLDSDAYPDIYWLENAKEILEENPNIGIVTGPEISFPDQTFFENCIGICNKSFLITGSHNFRKKNSKSRYYSEASGCNIIMKKNDYESVGGMDSNLYLGEDKDFSERVIKDLNKKVYFSNKVKVFHKDRNIPGYLVQRYARGIASKDFKEKIKKVLKNPTFENILFQRFEIYIPLIFTLFLSTFPLTFFFEFWSFLFSFIIIIFLMFIMLETIKYTYHKIKFFFPVFFLLIIGSILPGIAQLLEILDIKINIRKFYRNNNDF